MLSTENMFVAKTRKFTADQRRVATKIIHTAPGLEGSQKRDSVVRSWECAEEDRSSGLLSATCAQIFWQNCKHHQKARVASSQEELID